MRILLTIASAIALLSYSGQAQPVGKRAPTKAAVATVVADEGDYDVYNCQLGCLNRMENAKLDCVRNNPHWAVNQCYSYAEAAKERCDDRCLDGDDSES